jgi:hypothetical protein
MAYNLNLKESGESPYYFHFDGSNHFISEQAEASTIDP